MDKMETTMIMGYVGNTIGIHSFEEMLQGHRSCWA